MKIKKAKQSRVRPPAEFKIVRLRECPVDSPTLDKPAHVEKFWRECVATSPQFDPERETFVVFMLNTRLRFTGFQILSHGTKDTILVGTGEVFRLAAMHNAARIVIAHNHPSGDPSPSEADIKVTRDLIRAGQIVGIKVCDHVIIGDARREKGYASLRELGYIHADASEPADQAQAADGAATTAATPSKSDGAESEPLSPRSLAIDLADALAMLESRGQAAVAMTMLNADLIEESIKAYDGWGKFDVPGFGSGIYTMAHDLVFSFADAFAKYRDAYKKLMDRMLGCETPVSAAPSMSIQKEIETKDRILRAAGCKVDFQTVRDLEEVIGATNHCLNMQGMILVNRDNQFAGDGCDFLTEKLNGDLQATEAAACKLADAFVAVELNRAGQQRVAA